MVLDATAHMFYLLFKDCSHTPWKIAVKLKREKQMNMLCFSSARTGDSSGLASGLRTSTLEILSCLFFLVWCRKSDTQETEGN